MNRMKKEGESHFNSRVESIPSQANSKCLVVAKEEKSRERQSVVQAEQYCSSSPNGHQERREIEQITFWSHHRSGWSPSKYPSCPPAKENGKESIRTYNTLQLGTKDPF